MPVDSGCLCLEFCHLWLVKPKHDVRGTWCVSGRIARSFRFYIFSWNFTSTSLRIGRRSGWVFHPQILDRLVKLFFDTTSAARRCIDQITQAYQFSLLFLGFYDFCHSGFPLEKVVSSQSLICWNWFCIWNYGGESLLLMDMFRLKFVLLTVSLKSVSVCWFSYSCHTLHRRLSSLIWTNRLMFFISLHRATSIFG